MSELTPKPRERGGHELVRSSVVLAGAPGASRGTVVLFHGLTGTPTELLSVGEALHRAGYTTLLPCLSGHGDNIAALRRTSLAEWHNDVERLVETIPRLRAPYVVGGLSFGGLLAMDATRRAPELFSALILLAPPIRFRSPRREITLRALSMLSERFYHLLGEVKKTTPGFDRILPRPAYSHHSIAAAARLVQHRSLVLREALPTIPTLIMQDPEDHHLATGGVKQLAEKLGDAAQVAWIERGGHELTVGPRWTEVSEAVVSFVRHHTGGKNAA